MTDKNKIKRIRRDFQRKMQKLVDNNNSGITSISIEVCGEKHIIAEKKDKDNE